MVQKRTCDYTNEEIEPGTGTMFVRNDGTVLWFKNSKAQKNYMLGRESRDLEWIHGEDEQEGAQASAESEEAVSETEQEADAEETDSEDGETDTENTEEAVDQEETEEETEAEA
jgi:large subunit ribosomal protein L24e